MPNDAVTPGREGSPTPAPDSTPRRDDWRRFLPPKVLIPIVVVIAAVVVIGQLLPNGHRPECAHDPGHETIAGRYTPVPEYHDCQRLVVREGGALVYSEMVALFLSEEVIDGTIVGTPVVSNGLNLQVGPRITLPSGVDLGGAVILGRTSPRFEPGRGSRFPGTVIVAAPDTGTLGTATGEIVIPWVQVVADADYPPLGVEKGFNCMYFVVFTDASAAPIAIDAKMVFTGKTTYVDCGLPEYITQPGTQLKVTPNGSGEVPKATRWDWDSASETHLIGVPCPTPAQMSLTPIDSARPIRDTSTERTTAPAAGGTTTGTASRVWVPGNWCDVGASSAVGSVPHGVTPAQKAIKGWSDEQYLAAVSVEGPVRTDVMGTVFPEAGLKDRNADYYKGEFKTVAYVALRVTPAPVDDAAASAANAALQDYSDRFGFHAVDPSKPFGEMATIALCYGTSTECGVPENVKRCTAPSTGFDGQPKDQPWWARTQSAPGVSPAITKYHCVVYRGHNPENNFKMPNVVRWRFHPNPGETNWIACPQGCCEVEG